MSRPGPFLPEIGAWSWAMNRVRAQDDAAPCRAPVVMGDKSRMECRRDAGSGLCWLVRAPSYLLIFIPVAVPAISISHQHRPGPFFVSLERFLF